MTSPHQHVASELERMVPAGHPGRGHMAEAADIAHMALMQAELDAKEQGIDLLTVIARQCSARLEQLRGEPRRLFLSRLPSDILALMGL